MKKTKRFEELKAWQHGRTLAREVRCMCRTAPFGKDYEFVRQMTRAAISTMNNVAEGYGRRSPNDFAHFLDIARGSAAEVQSMLYLAMDDELINKTTFDKIYGIADETAATIAGLSNYLRRT